MIRVNEHYLKLKSSYLFSEIARRVKAHQQANPAKEIIRLGIGDVTRALPPVCIKAMHAAVGEMAADASFRGYGPEQGYDFLREAIAENDYRPRGAQVSADEVFVSDGSKCDTGNMQEILAQDTVLAIPDPVYPVYIDTNVMAGRTGPYYGDRYADVVYLNCTADNAYVPRLPDIAVDLIYLCFPNNPTGATITKDQLRQWVDYARKNRALILYDAAYVAFLRDPALPQSIYEIPGSREVAIEFRSYSKTAGFTGTRCAYTVVPKDCMGYDRAGNPYPLHALWNRRHTTKFNGVSYPIQRAAAAIYTAEGQQQIREINDYYLANAKMIRQTMTGLGYACSGGENAPYIWIKTEGESWKFFDLLLEKAGVVCTPGAGFGACGEGHIRISAFNNPANVEKALARIRQALG